VLPSLAEAEQWHDAAQMLALGAERRALSSHLASQPVRYSAMGAEHAETTMIVERLSRQIRELEKKWQNQALDTVETEVVEIDINDPAYALANRLVTLEAAQKNEYVSLNEKLATARDHGDQVIRNSRELSDRFATARRLVDFGGDSDVLGGVLQVYWHEIKGYQVPFSTNNISREVGEVVISRIKYEQTLKGLVSTTGYINRELSNDGIEPDTVSATSRDAVAALARSYRDRLRSTMDVQSDYLEALRELGDGSVKLSLLTEEYRKYLQSLILWLPVRQPLWGVDAKSVPVEFAVLNKARQSSSLSIQPGLLMGMAAFALLLALGSRLSNFQQQQDKLISRPRDDSVGHTVLALGCTALRALPVPLLMMGVSTLFSNEIAVSVLMNTSIALLVLLSIRLICEPTGVGPVHFGWPDALTARLHRECAWLIYLGVPLTATAFYIMGETNVTPDAVLGRIAIIAAISLPFFLVLASFGGVAKESPTSWFSSLTIQLRIGLVIALAFLIAGVVFGHSYSVEVILSSLADTVLVGFGLILAHGILSRWVVVTRRKLRLEELMIAMTDLVPADDSIVEDPEENLEDVSAESKEFINMGVLVTAFILLLYIWAPLLPAFDALTRITLWASSDTVDGQQVDSSFTLAALLMVIFLIAATFYAARKLPALIELILRSRTEVSPSSRYTVIALLNYVIVGAGITAALSALGLQWSQLQWLVAALGVGIGFGLQEIIANFISGLIILFERPIRVGDIISIGGHDGKVTRIRIRATSILNWDGKELLVPNKEFITTSLLNWTLSDVKVRIVIPIGVAYGSDVELAIRTLDATINNHPRVVDEPPLQIIFEGFGDNALLLSARLYLDSMENRMLAITEINQSIYQQFNEAGIVISFPQRDIHFDSEKPIRISLDGVGDKPG
jgi:potassium efflux system protein